MSEHLHFLIRRIYLIRFIISFGSLMPTMVCSQIAIPRDTSYNLESAFRKYKTDYPQIELAIVSENDSIESFLDVVYHSIGQRFLHADVYKPHLDSGGFPGIFMIHGGGWASGDKSLLTSLAKALALKGFVTINIEYRLSPEAKYPAAVLDIKMALNYFKNHAKSFGIDKEKIAILGCSAGAQLATLVGTNPDIDAFRIDAMPSNFFMINAIVNIDGIVAFIHSESAEGNAASRWMGGSSDEIPEIWKEASPLTYVNEETPPILFINSSFPRFHAGRDDFIRVLNKSGTYSKVHTFQDSPHSFWLFHPWFQPTVEYIATFLNMVLE